MKRRTGIALVALVLCCSTACGKNKSKTTRPMLASDVSLQTIWPNQNGLAWNYRIRAREWTDVGPRYYGSVDSVPPIPSLSQIALLLGVQGIGANPASDSATFQLQFNGQMTTGSGVTAQRLQETVFRPAPVMNVAGRPARFASPWSESPSGFLQELARARPDLAPKLEGFGVRPLGIQDTLIDYRPTLFLFGYAWRLTSEWIGSYGDVDTAVAWKYLTKYLAPGSEFTHQLIPSLASNIYLHGRILARQTVTTLDGTFPNAVVCLYSVDYGVGTQTDNQGNFVGYYRQYSYGTIAYADSVGPVASYERRMIGLGKPSLGVADVDLVLSSRSPGP